MKKSSATKINNIASITRLLKTLALNSGISVEQLDHMLIKLTDEKGQVYSKNRLLQKYNMLKEQKLLALSPLEEANLLQNLRKKPIRTLSGVTTVTVLTTPYPCPGRCVFCPTEVQMPKSYLSNEPGAQRALANQFDPYLQTYNRLVALKSNGHNTDKIELIVLGGTFTFYDLKYQIWFITRCFDALNEFTENSSVYKDPNDFKATIEDTSYELNTEAGLWIKLKQQHTLNELAYARCVGLSLETRPDEINVNTINNLRRLGATKIQFGVQTLDDAILKLNKRGHTNDDIRTCFRLLRSAGFKIQVHWMPNLYGSDVKKDIELYKILMTSPEYMPDEVKIYPCSLIQGTELVDIYNKGLWKPYSYTELLEVLTNYMQVTPRFCRISRMIRDIPSTSILEGNKLTNLRQYVEDVLHKKGININEIRSREIKNTSIKDFNLTLKITKYTTTVSDEYFIEYVTDTDKLAGFLRLYIPLTVNDAPCDELNLSAIIREIHVYGQSINIGEQQAGAVQHTGLGKSLIIKAEELTKQHNIKILSVISAVGTREYYRKNGFNEGVLYQYKML